MSTDHTKASRATPRGRRFLPAAAIVLVALAIRLPFFFPAVIDWDESTYIIGGQALLDGDVLYQDIWENKPPLLFAFFAASIAVLGKSISAVRLAGVVCVVAAALLVRAAASRIATPATGTTAALIYVAAASLLPSAQATMTEHPAVVPLLAALCLLGRPAPGFRILLAAGALAGTAAMIRTNLAVVAVAVAAILALDAPRAWSGIVAKRVAVYAAGGAAVVGLTAVPYYDRLGVWWSGVVVAPLRYAGSQASMLDVLKSHFLYLLRAIAGLEGSIVGVAIVAGAGGFAGGFLLVTRFRSCTSPVRRHLLLFGIALLATALSILGSGVAHGHYLIQLAPFAAIGAAVFWIDAAKRTGRVVPVAVALLVAVSLAPVATEYRTMAVHALEGVPLRYGPAYEIAAELEPDARDGRTMLLLTDHVTHWLLGSRPFAPSVTHPSNVGKHYLLPTIPGAQPTPEAEMAALLARRPHVIVTLPTLDYLSQSRSGVMQQMLLDQALARDYRLVNRIEGRLVYRRVDR
jgi:4-amino-4-deoxy-L-arabinose transferase-like glycosyltransferase